MDVADRAPRPTIGSRGCRRRSPPVATRGRPLALSATHLPQHWAALGGPPALPDLFTSLDLILPHHPPTPPLSGGQLDPVLHQAGRVGGRPVGTSRPGAGTALQPRHIVSCTFSPLAPRRDSSRPTTPQSPSPPPSSLHHDTTTCSLQSTPTLDSPPGGSPPSRGRAAPGDCLYLPHASPPPGPHRLGPPDGRGGPGDLGGGGGPAVAAVVRDPCRRPPARRVRGRPAALTAGVASSSASCGASTSWTRLVRPPPPTASGRAGRRS